jgi:L-threonylcarbamoyladenylate synthase
MEPERHIATKLLSAHDPHALLEAQSALRHGQVVVFPTDTVYGVACDLWNARAIERLYWAKQRALSLAIPVLVSSAEHVGQVARDLPAAFEALVGAFWPGGLTLVVPRRAEVPAILCAQGDTIAVRMPDHPVALEIIAGMGGALAVTSANLSGRPSPRTADEAWADLNGRVAIVLDGGECPIGVASAIIDLVADAPVLLRKGELDIEMLRRIVPTLVVAKT